MNLEPDCTLSYVIGTEAYYWRGDEEPYVSVSSDSSGGGSDWSFQVTEHELGDRTVCVSMFADSFRAFEQVPELFLALRGLDVESDGLTRAVEPVALADVVAVLDELGAVDKTPRVNPYANSAPAAPSDYERGIRDALAQVRAEPWRLHGVPS